MKKIVEHLKYGVLSALHWWLEGLRIPLSEKLQKLLFPSKSKIVFHITNTSFKVSGLDETLPNTTSSSQISGSLEEIIPILSDISGSKNIEIVLSIEEDYVLTKRLSIPAASQHDLDSIIGFELERLTPFDINQIHYDYYIEKANKDSEFLTVIVCLAPTPQLESILEFPKKAHISSLIATTQGSNGKLLPINLLSKKKNKSLRSYMLPFRPLYAIAAFVSCLILLQAPLWRYESFYENLSQEVNQNRTQALKLREELTTVNANNSREQFLGKKQSEYLAPINLLNELSESLPEHTWLHSFSISSDTIQLEGESISAAETLEFIENNPYLKNAEFSAPVSNTGTDGVEKFHISSMIRWANEY